MSVTRAFGLLALVLLAIVVAVLWVDVPLSQALSHFGFARAVFRSRPLALPVLPVLSFVVLALGVGLKLAGRPLPRWLVAGSLAAVALLASLWLTEEVFKPIFGRVIPSVALRGHESGFHWLRRGAPFQSFPSGHSVQASAIIAVFWGFYPKLRGLMVAGFALIAVALMVGEWHYLGDIIAGGLVGTLGGIAVVRLWGLVRGKRPSIRPRPTQAPPRRRGRAPAPRRS